MRVIPEELPCPRCGGMINEFHAIFTDADCAWFGSRGILDLRGHAGFDIVHDAYECPLCNEDISEWVRDKMHEYGNINRTAAEEKQQEESDEKQRSKFEL